MKLNWNCSGAVLHLLFRVLQYTLHVLQYIFHDLQYMMHDLQYKSTYVNEKCFSGYSDTAAWSMKDYDADGKLMNNDSGVFGNSKRFEWAFSYSDYSDQ